MNEISINDIENQSAIDLTPFIVLERMPYTQEGFLNIANSVLAETERLNTHYPGIYEKMMASGPVTGINMVNSKTVAVRYEQGVRITGFFNPSSNQVALCVAEEAGYGEAMKESLNLWQRKWSAVDGPNGVLRHELGHKLFHALGNSDAKAKWLTLWQNRWPDFRRTPASPFEEISQYALSNENEAFAEAFAAFTHPAYKVGGGYGSLATDIENFFVELNAGV